MKKLKDWPRRKADYRYDGTKKYFKGGKRINLMINFPKHKALFLSHNEFRTNLETIDEAVSKIDDEDWISQKEKELAIRNESIWELQWYPDTQIGFKRVVASNWMNIFEYLSRNILKDKKTI